MRGMGGMRREGKRGGEERGREGEEAFLVMWPRRLSALNPPLGGSTNRGPRAPGAPEQ